MIQFIWGKKKLIKLSTFICSSKKNAHANPIDKNNNYDCFVKTDNAYIDSALIYSSKLVQRRTYCKISRFVNLISKRYFQVYRMANINGTYKNEKNENLDEYLKASGKSINHVSFLLKLKHSKM